MLTKKEKRCLEEMTDDFIEENISVKVAKQYLGLHGNLPADPTRLQVLNYAKCKMIIDPGYNRLGLTQKGKTHISGDVNGRPNRKGAERIGQGIDTLHKKAAEQIKNYDKEKDFIDFLLSEKSDEVHTKKFSAFHNEETALEYIKKTLLGGFLVDTKSNRLSPEIRKAYLSGKFGEPFAGGHNNVCLLYREETDRIGFDLDIPRGENSRTLKECTANAVRLTFEKGGGFHAIPCQVLPHKVIDSTPTDEHQNQRRALADKIKQAKNNLTSKSSSDVALGKRKQRPDEEVDSSKNSSQREALAEKIRQAKQNLTLANSSESVLGNKKQRLDEGTVRNKNSDQRKALAEKIKQTKENLSTKSGSGSFLGKRKQRLNEGINSSENSRKKLTIDEDTNRSKKSKKETISVLSKPKYVKEKESKKASLVFAFEETKQKNTSTKVVQPTTKVNQGSESFHTSTEYIASKIKQTKDFSNTAPKASKADIQPKQAITGAKLQPNVEVIQCSESIKTSARSSIASKIRQAKDSYNTAPKAAKVITQSKGANVNTELQTISTAKAAPAKNVSAVAPLHPSPNKVNSQSKASATGKTVAGTYSTKTSTSQASKNGTAQVTRERERAAQAARDRAAQVARDRAAQAARDRAAQVARDRAAQIARDRAAQVARDRAAQIARDRAAQVARDRAAQVARDRAAQVARDRAAQIARDRAAQIARDRAAQVARDRVAQAARARDIQARAIMARSIRR